MFLYTGSVVLPVKALVLNGLTLSAVLGAMTWVFQDGHLSGVLGFTPGPLSTTMPPLLFCIAFGLSKVSFIQFFGIGTALAILIDATLVRAILVPAFMRLAGSVNWWSSGPLRVLHRRIGLSES